MSTQTDEKIYMTWERFDKDIDIFVEFITEQKFIADSVILTLKRGAFPTACKLSNKTGIPISVVSYQTRDGNDEKPVFLEPDLIRNAKRIIIPDDIYDTGKTVTDVITALISGNADFNIGINDILGLFHYGSDEIHNSILNNYKIITPNNGKWVVMPWE
jgi:hypoxanthine phosphoribosyltransferase